MALRQLTERVHVWEGAVNFGLIVGDRGDLILVDSGLDSSAARKALRPFLETGHRLAAILHTHAHADHIGGSGDLVRRTGCQVFAPEREVPFILWPELAPLALYGGAWPHPGLQTRFLQAEPAPLVGELRTAPCRFAMAGVPLELVPIPGHSLQQVAVAADGVLLTGDGFFPPSIITKHPIIFLVNVAEYLSSLERIANRPERFVLPSHGPLIDRASGSEDPLPEMLEANRAALARMQAAILEALDQPLGEEQLLYRVVKAMGRQLENETQYFLDRAALSAHLTYLIEQDKVRISFESGRRFLFRKGSPKITPG